MPDPTAPDPVSALFARAAAALAAAPAAAGVTVTTADRANPLGPWSLAWAECYNLYGNPGFTLLIRRHVDADELAEPWDDAPPAARLATLDQLPELVSRVAGAVAKAEEAAKPGSIELIGRDLAGALGALRGPAGPEPGPGPVREGGRP